MRKHNGMRPHDIVVLLKIVSFGECEWLNKDLANELFISSSEISESLYRSFYASLLDYDKKRVNRQGLMEFLQHGLQYVFPQHPGSMVNGIATAHAHPYMKEHFSSNVIYVWPDALGKERGLAIEPLYPNQVNAVKADNTLHLLLALTDVIRVGRAREKQMAIKKLSKELLNEP